MVKVWIAAAGVSALAWRRFVRKVIAVSTVTEIETAIEKLPPDKVEELAAWLDEYRHTLHASESVFTGYDEEEKRPG